MKCDELKYENLGDMMPFYPRSTLVIRKQFVDTAIAELKEIIEKNRTAYYVDLGVIADDCEKLKAENEKLNRELEHVKNGDCINTCDVVEKHVKEELKAKRALWIARAERAHLKVLEYWPDYCHNAHCRIAEQKWDKVERKCRAKAEEYK